MGQFFEQLYNHQYILLQAVAAVYSMFEPTHENGIWDKKGTECMVVYLCDHASEAGDGGNFKDSAYLAAVKTEKHVKYKYRSVSATQ